MNNLERIRMNIRRSLQWRTVFSLRELYEAYIPEEPLSETCVPEIGHMRELLYEDLTERQIWQWHNINNGR